MKEKVLVLDIDGTLTNSEKEITPATKRGIQSVMERGHKVILASGRPTPGMRRYEEELELKKYGGYLLSFNGGRIIDCQSGEIIYQRILPSVAVPELYDFAKKNSCGLITYEGDCIISAFEPDEYVELESRINGLEIKVVDNFKEYVDFDVNKCLITAPVENAPGFEEQLRQKYSDTLSIYRSEPFFIEIMPQKVDKAASLDRMLEAIGLTKEDAICCGDGFNDISMIKYAGVGVAMGNAREDVKRQVGRVCGVNENDGVARYMEALLL